MVRTFDFDVVKNTIEQALHLADYHHLKVFEDTLSRIIQELQKIIDNSLIPSQFDFATMRRMKALYFMIITKMN